MTTRGRDPETGSRAAAIANAKVRARQEDRPIYVLEYLDGERTYTACINATLSQQRTRVHGKVDRWGREIAWVPTIILDVDDVLAFLHVIGADAIAERIESRRGVIS